MSRLSKTLMRRLLGTTDVGSAGYRRTLTGLREGDRRELAFGLFLAGVAYLQRSQPRKELIHRQTVPSGAALVIHNRESGRTRLEITKTG